jgi:ATP-binding cassette subfamily B protein
MRICRRCGSANDELARICSRCRSPLPGEFTRSLGGMGRSVERTEHFELHVAAGSFADQHAAEIGAGLEATAAALRDVLALTDGAAEHIRVYLGEMLPAPRGAQASESNGSWAVLERGEIWSIYRPDAPGIELDRAALRLLLWQAARVDLDAAPLVWQGILGICRRQLRGRPPASEVDGSLVAMSGGQAVPLQALWQRPGAEGPDASLAATSFLSYLLDRYGRDRLRTFVTAAVGSSADDAARAAYRTSIARLQKAWWKSVLASGRPAAGGIIHFLLSSFHHLRPYWKQEAGIVALLGVQLAFQQIFPRAQALLIDRAILPRDLRFLLGLVVFLFGMVVLVLMAGVLNDLLTSRVSESVLRSMRERMFVQLQRASHRFYNRMESGDLLSRFGSDLRSVQQGLTGTLTQGAFLVLSLVLSTVHILLINWLLAVLVLLTLPLFLLSTKFLGPPANRASLAFSQEQAAITSVVQEEIAAQPVVKAYNLQAFMLERFRAQAQALYRSAVRLFFLSSLFGVTANLLTTAVQVGILALGGYFVIEGRLLLGNLIEFLALLGLVIGPVQNMSGLLQGIQIAAASMDRVEEILNLEPDVQDAPNATELMPLRRSIRFENVGFSFDGERRQLDDISLEISAGQTVAFVGPSGSGKSTMLSLLMRFYEPDCGRVVVDGCNLRAVTLESLRAQIGTVFQENFLFNTSVRENIRYGRQGATDAEVEDAAKQAEIHEFILQLPQGYETSVGERGGNLSGGQRQRLAIARAILRQPSILVLDEATSALDARTENAVSHTLAALGSGRTTVSVTHRLATAATADRIFVLDGGRLVEQGTHEELLAAHGLYQHLYEEQGGSTAGGERALQVAYLRGVPLFEDLGDELLGQIAPLLRVQRAVPGERVLEAGDEADKLYLIVSGELEVLAPSAVGEDRLLALLGPGGYFGEIALLQEIARTATVRARTATHLLTLEKHAFHDLLRQIPLLRSRLDSAIAARTAAESPFPPPPEHDEPARPLEAAALEIVRGPERGLRFTLSGSVTGLGRNASNDVVLAERTVSGFHARIVRMAGGKYQIVDSKSTNGTFVNGARVGNPVTLADGDELQLGGFSLSFHANGR